MRPVPSAFPRSPAVRWQLQRGADARVADAAWPARRPSAQAPCGSSRSGPGPNPPATSVAPAARRRSVGSRPGWQLQPVVPLQPEVPLQQEVQLLPEVPLQPEAPLLRAWVQRTVRVPPALPPRAPARLQRAPSRRDTAAPAVYAQTPARVTSPVGPSPSWRLRCWPSVRARPPAPHPAAARGFHGPRVQRAVRGVHAARAADGADALHVPALHCRHPQRRWSCRCRRNRRW